MENKDNSLPTEKEVLQTIFDSVYIRGINLEDYKRNFTNEECGLYDSLVKLFSNKSPNSKVGKIEIKNFQYSEQAVKWINENNIDAISIADAGRFSEGVRVMYRIS